jgi:hypothetical protein
MLNPPCGPHTASPLSATLPQGLPSIFVALHIRCAPDPNCVRFAASSNAGGAVFRPPHGFVLFRMRPFFDALQVSRVKNSSDIPALPNTTTKTDFSLPPLYHPPITPPLYVLPYIYI